MSQTTTLNLLSQQDWSNVSSVTGNLVANVVGNAYPASSYYLSCKDMQTINVNCTKLVGNVIVEASLVTSPSADTDWFQVYKLEANVNAVANTAQYLAATSSVGVNVTGNFVWMRARVANLASGTLNFVKVSY